MKCLVVIAHPINDSMCHMMARASIEALVAAGHDVEVEDLYRAEFSPSLTPGERRTYYRLPFSHLEGDCRMGIAGA